MSNDLTADFDFDTTLVQYGDGACLELHDSVNPAENTIKFSCNDETTLELRPDHFVVNGIRVDPKTPDEAREVVEAFKAWLREAGAK